MAKSGDRCEKCKRGRYAVMSSRCGGPLQYRYIKCSHCGNNETEVVEEKYIRRRKYFTG